MADIYLSDVFFPNGKFIERQIYFKYDDSSKGVMMQWKIPIRNIYSRNDELGQQKNIYKVE